MIFLAKAAVTSYPVKQLKRRAEALRGHGAWRRLIEHGTYGLISAEKSDLPKDVNNVRTHELYHHLSTAGYSPVPATGYYGGHPERSFLVSSHDHKQLHQQLGHLAKKFNQESYIVRHNGEHKMVFPSGTSEHPTPHHLKGTQILHHLTPGEDRSLLHTGTNHNYPFRMNDFFDNPAHEGLGRSLGIQKSYACMGHTHQPRHAFVVVHTGSGSKRFSLHFHSQPFANDELMKAFAPPTLQARQAGAAAHEWRINHPNGVHELHPIAGAYAASRGLPRIRTTHLLGNWRTGNGLDPATGSRIARAYEHAPHTPDDPATQKSYAAFRNEVHQQANHLISHGYKPEPWTKGGQPYHTAGEMIKDVQHNKHIYYVPSHIIGSPGHKLLSDEHNDRFRWVHDVFGHAMGGNKFGPHPSHGETHAFLDHYQMFSPLARRAMATETLGQNSWFNFSKHNEGKPVHQKDFAQQKATLLHPSLYSNLLRHTGLIKALRAMGLLPPGGGEEHPEDYGFCPAHPNRRHTN